jgi:hypothetical protein
MTTQEQIHVLNLIKRLEVRCDNLRLDFKSKGQSYQHDMNAMLSQLATLKRLVTS